MTASRREGLALLELPENKWLTEILSLYLDVKDHYPGLVPQHLTPRTRAAFRALREGSAGRLGAPSLL